ncbi:Hypothetical predicted protein [Cloeon dipterum]|uniref:pyrroline-5-carboxylate reductase n=1 Tax=Cloeon dipterum TaxID=197152 RepID=A0A8S1CCD3_9INSE|nr:Hypothetical predicted protein [Cloeon dipterum]
MAWAIFQNLLKNDALKVTQIIVTAPSERNLGKWKEAGAKTTTNNTEIFKTCEIIILAMKPQQFKGDWKGALTCLKQSKEQIYPIYISVLAGISTQNVEKILKEKNCVESTPSVVRTMPNTPMMVGFGATVICPGSNCNKICIETTKLIFGAGNCVVEEVSESLLDAAGALVGCGPAFAYQFIECLADGAVSQGVPRDLANILTAQMVMGAAKMVQQTEKHPGLLKDEVCSPGGTTIAGIHALRRGNNFGVAIMDAIEASTTKSKQLND